MRSGHYFACVSALAMALTLASCQLGARHRPVQADEAEYQALPSPPPPPPPVAYSPCPDGTLPVEGTVCMPPSPPETGPPRWEEGELGGNSSAVIGGGPLTGDASGATEDSPAAGSRGKPVLRVRAVRSMAAEAAASLDCTAELLSAPACAEIRALLASGRERDIDASAQNPMYRGESAWVRARLHAPDVPPERRPGSTPVVTGKVLATKIMRAQLTGTGFDIEPRGWQEKPTSMNREADWEWTVIPRLNGKRTLRVTVQPVMRAAGGSEVIGKDFGKDLDVQVRIKGRDAAIEAGGFLETAGKQWAAALGALAAAAAAAWGLWRALRGKSDGKAAAGGDGKGEA